MKVNLLIGLASLAAATVVNQASTEGGKVHNKFHLKHINYSGDSLFAHPVEGYPAETNMALTKSFIFGTSAPTMKHGKMV